MKSDNANNNQCGDKPLQTISECMRAQLNMRRAHGTAHSIGRPGAPTALPENSTRPAAPFALMVVSDSFEHFQPVILINTSKI